MGAAPHTSRPPLRRFLRLGLARRVRETPRWRRRVGHQEPCHRRRLHAAAGRAAQLLVVHGTKDLSLLPEYAQEAYDAAVGPKELVWIETHNHIELYDQDPYVSEACRMIVDWLGRVLPVP